MVEGGSWVDRAACKGEDISVFVIPSRPGKVSKAFYDRALSFCRRCEVVEECLKEAESFTDYEDRFTVRGGMTPRERYKRRRENARGSQMV